MTLTEFLHARIDEDEPAAAAYHRMIDSHGAGMPVYVKPSRVLAECEAKRRIVDAHLNGDAWCDHCSGGEHMGNPNACPTLRLLALPYADHPGYDEKWKP